MTVPRSLIKGLLKKERRCHSGGRGVVIHRFLCSHGRWGGRSCFTDGEGTVEVQADVFCSEDRDILIGWGVAKLTYMVTTYCFSVEAWFGGEVCVGDVVHHSLLAHRESSVRLRISWRGGHGW